MIYRHAQNSGGGGEVAFTSRIRVHCENDLMIPGFSIQKLNFGHVDFDGESEWDADNYRFVAKGAGCYSIKASCDLMNYNGSLFLNIYKNADETNPVLVCQNVNQSEQSSYCLCSDLVHLEIGDYLDVRIVHMGWNPISVSDSTCVYFSVHCIS